MIDVKCACGSTLRVPDEYSGKVGRCVKCGANLVVPEAQADLVFTTDGSTVRVPEQHSALLRRLAEGVTQRLGPAVESHEVTAVGAAWKITTAADRNQVVMMNILAPDAFTPFVFLATNIGTVIDTVDTAAVAVMKNINASAIPMKALLPDNGPAQLIFSVPFTQDEPPGVDILADCIRLLAEHGDTFDAGLNFGLDRY